MKLIKIYSLIIFITVSTTVKSQSDTLQYHKFMVSVSAGVAIPFAEFSKFEYNSHEYVTIITGVPQVGINGELFISYYFRKNLGVYGKLSTSLIHTNPVDSADLFYDPSPYSHGQGGRSTLISYHYNTNNWQTRELLFGILYKISKGNNIINFKIAGGVQKAVSPKAQLNQTVSVWRLHGSNYYPDNYIYNSTSIQPQMTSINFIADAGIDWAFRIKNNFGMILKLDCLVSKASFNGMTEETFNVDDGVNQIQHSETINCSYSKNIELFTLGIGIYYSL